MQDSDDLYFGDDDLIVDEATIAALDAVERTYAATQKQPKFQADKRRSPPPKRIKVDHDWGTHPEKKKRTRNAFDDVPDIFVKQGGMYSVSAEIQSKAPSPTVIRVPSSQQPVLRSVPHRKPVSHPARATNLPESSFTGPSRSRQEPISRHVSGPVFGSQLTGADRTTAPPITAMKDRNQRVHPKSGAEAEVSRLKRQIEMLNAQLEDSRGQVVQKDGEVTVLRATMQRTTDEHMSELAKIEAAKNQAEAAKIELQKEHKEELERLKTAYVFKQHEIEASARRPPWSARKIMPQMNMTPLKIPPEIRAWSSNANGVANNVANNVATVDFAETPRRQRFGEIETPSRPRRHVPSSQREDTATNLPGFFNSFAETSPTRPFSQRTKRNDKGKEKAREEDVFVAPPSPPSSPTRYGMRMSEVPDLLMEDVAPPPPTPRAPEAPALWNSPPNQDGDIMMSTPPIQGMPTQEAFDGVQPPDWTDTIHRLLFAHTMPSTKTPTLQLLLNSPLPASTPPDHLQAYSSATARLLESVAAGSDFVEWTGHLRTLLKILTSMAALLVAHDSISPLSALFNMLRSMARTIPSFVEVLLSPLPEEAEAPAKIATTMRDAIQRYAASAKEAVCDTPIAILASETVALLEALSWNVPETVVPRLCTVIRAPKVLITLLGPQQPAALVRDTARTLAILATHPNFFRQLLAHPYPEAGQDQVDADDIRSIEHLDQLYAYLADCAKDAALKDAILAFITTVALAHADAVTILLQSYILIPSIISYLTDVTNPLWEEDLDLMASQPQIDWVIQTTNRLVALLSYMLFSSPTTYNLRYKLHHLPHRRFNGIAHMFTVTMSRLSFADPPSWLTEVQKVQLEQTMDMATKLLELVIDGPELEVAWSAFQVDTESRPETEEEREARLLHPDDTE